MIAFVSLKAFTMNNRRSRLVILGLGDPHLLKGRQRGKDGTTNPDRVFTFRRCNDLDLHGGRGKGGELLGHAFSDSGEHGGSSRHNDVGVKVSADVDVALHDGLESAVVDTAGLFSDE